MLKQIKTSAINFVSVTLGFSKCFDVSFNPLTGNLENRFFGVITHIGYRICPTHAFDLRSAYHAILIDGNRGYLEFSDGSNTSRNTWFRVVSQLLDTRITRASNSSEIAEIIYKFVDELLVLLSECTYCYDIGSVDFNDIIIGINDGVFINFPIPVECCDDVKCFLNGVFGKMIYVKITFKEYT